jgi:hypothetical protein
VLVPRPEGAEDGKPRLAHGRVLEHFLYAASSGMIQGVSGVARHIARAIAGFARVRAA